MTKNHDPSADEYQTITVVNENFEVLGKTYPKRAKGLIKKGRAEFLSDTLLRLKDFCPMSNTEEIIMDNNIKINDLQNIETTAETAEEAIIGSADKPVEIAVDKKHEFILFDPRKWYPNPDTANMNRCERYMYQSPDGSMSEIYTLGDWNGHWSEIRSRFITVDPETEYTFVFWLNGGENDRNNEVCRMVAVYTDTPEQHIPDEDWQQNYIYKLNRGGVKYLKTIDGWYLFAIRLPKPDKKYLELRFIAQSAPMALRAAEEPHVYLNLEDKPDEFAAMRPQRHNIFFAEGWPADDGKGHGHWYSTGYLRRKAAEDAKKAVEFETLKNEWKSLVIKHIERAKTEGYTGGELKINGVSIFNINGINDIDVDELAKNLAEKYPQMLIDRTPESQRAAECAKRIDEISELLKPFANWGSLQRVGIPEIRSRLEKLSETLRSGFGFGKEANVGRIMNEVNSQLKSLKNNNSMTNGVRIADVAWRFSNLRDEFSEYMSAGSGAARSTVDANDVDLDNIAEQVAESIDISDIADNLDISDIAGNIDISEIADNIDIDEIAEQVADNVDMSEIAEHVAENIDLDEIAEHVKDNIDLDEIAESVADHIDLDDLADKIAEKLDIRGLLREILED